MNTVLTDPDQVRAALEQAPVPHAPQGRHPIGMAWLRANVPRFCDGEDHARRRALVLAELVRLAPADLHDRVLTAAGPLPHVTALAEAMGLHGISAESVEIVAAHYHPHEPDSAAADAAVAELVAACGGVADEITAARICVLVQSCAATNGLVANVRARGGSEPIVERIEQTMRDDPPLRVTRRVIDGELVELDMRHPGLGWGAGPHACPGREHATALAAGILARDGA
ncbi:hypothetical protein [Nocardia arthritidis]|uniref:Cytochrome P450 n=1 Tax=Nocardia arthritidis TaxID=228602 RepID=A0A6G9YD98_9NOCA|nr:hypothetical protein [Nocardia arthritidis]QIS11201.1 hypothetical protein F5544_16610 [Nocardia arthritidis]